MPAITLNISKKMFNPVYLPFLDDRSRYEVLYGGSGSGKSVFVAQKLVLQHLQQKRKNTLIVREVSNTNRLSTFPLIKQIINQWKVAKFFKINESDMRIKCTANGNEIAFAGLDDVEKLKSITFENGELTDIWIEEASEIEETDFNQLDLRLRGKTDVPKQIILSFNPVNITHWLKTVFFDNKKPGSITLKTTYKDNHFIDDEYKRVLEAFRDTDYYYYSVYALGEWGVVGKTVFNAQIVTQRLIEVRNRKPLAVGSFVFDYVGEQIVDSSIKFSEDGTGPLTIYEQPKQLYPYVIGGDIAEGGVDFSVGQVRNNVTWKQAAIWRGHTDTDLYAKQMYCLGKYYNEALIGIESNFDLHPIKELERLGYHRQFKREVIDEISKKRQHKYGFMTTKITRPVIISKYVAMVRDHIDTWQDITTLEEMLTFVRDSNGKPTAQDGKHDDCILADAICLGIREQQQLDCYIDTSLHFPPGMTAEEKDQAVKNVAFAEQYQQMQEQVAQQARTAKQRGRMGMGMGRR